VQVSKDDAVAENEPVTPVVPEQTGAAAPEAQEEKKEEVVVEKENFPYPKEYMAPTAEVEEEVTVNTL
jgi:hypothetical protein